MPPSDVTLNQQHLVDEYERGKSIIFQEKIFLEFEDNYEHLNESVEYIVENILYEPSTQEEINSKEFQHVKDLYNTLLNSSCCCVDLNCTLKEKCHHSSNFKEFVNDCGQKELVLNNNRPCKDLIYECNERCSCPPTCTNRLVQCGPRKNLQIFDTNNAFRGKGLLTTKPIPKGGFICEYAGEIITKSEAERRIRLNFIKKKMNYIICLNETCTEESDGKSKSSIQTFIDPSVRGNIGKYLNHSCDPNCEILSVRIETPIPKLGIFAKKDIKEFEELCFHYGENTDKISEEISENSIPCQCGAANCSGYLPNLEF